MDDVPVSTPVRSATAPRSDPEQLATDLRLLIGRLARRLRQQGETGVTASLMSAMWSIERLQPVTLGELSTAERVQPPTITRIANSLESAGLVRRETDPSDRRVCRVRLTSKGQRLLDRTRSQRTAYLNRRLRVLEPADRRILEQAVPVLERLLEDG